MMKITHLFTKSCLHFNPAIHLFRDAFLRIIKAKGKTFLIFSVLFHFNALGSSECKDIFSDSFYRMLEIERKKITKELAGDYTGVKQLDTDLNAVGQRLQARYEEDPDQFLSTLKEKLNISLLREQREQGDTLKVLRYMTNPPLEVFQLIKVLLEKDIISDNNNKYAYDIFMKFEITDKSILQWLKSRSKRKGFESTLAIRVLNEQDRKQALKSGKRGLRGFH